MLQLNNLSCMLELEAAQHERTNHFLALLSMLLVCALHDIVTLCVLVCGCVCRVSCALSLCQ